MAMEAFLINPARRRRRIKRKTTGSRRKRRGGLPSALLKRMVHTYGARSGMKKAWQQYRKGVRKNFWPDNSAGHSKAAVKGWRRKRRTKAVSRRRVVSGRRKNPFGEEVLVYGMNPRRRRKRVSRSRSRRRRSLPMLFNPMMNRRYQRRSRRRNLALNRRRRYGRRYRRNPAAGLPAISMRRPMSILMPAAIGAAGFYAADKVPAMLNMAANPMSRLAVKAGIGFAGNMFLGRFIGKRNAVFFSIGAGINLVNDILNTYILKGGLAGFGAFPYAFSAYPEEVAGVEAYPSESGYPL